MPVIQPQETVDIGQNLCKNKVMNKTAIALKSQLEFGLGDRLSKSLHVAGISTTEMAHELEMSRATISNYLNGHTKPKRLYLKMWALKTGVPLEWLETGTFPETPETEKTPHPDNPDGGDQSRLGESNPLTYSLQGNRLAEIIPFRRVS